MSKDDRTSLARDIGRALLDPNFRDMLNVKGVGGDRPIYPARVEDTVGDVMARLASSGGAGNVIFRWENGLAVLAISAPVVSAKSKKGRARRDACQEVGDTASIGTLLAAMAQDGLGTMLVRIVPSVPPAPGKPAATVIEGSRAVLPSLVAA